MYITKLLAKYKINKNVELMLNGFLDFHRTYCNKDDCPSK